MRCSCFVAARLAHSFTRRCICVSSLAVRVFCRARARAAGCFGLVWVAAVAATQGGGYAAGQWSRCCEGRPKKENHFSQRNRPVLAFSVHTGACLVFGRGWVRPPPRRLVLPPTFVSRRFLFSRVICKCQHISHARLVPSGAADSPWTSSFLLLCSLSIFRCFRTLQKENRVEAFRSIPIRPWLVRRSLWRRSWYAKRGRLSWTWRSARWMPDIEPAAAGPATPFLHNAAYG